MLPPNVLFPPQEKIKPGVVLRGGRHGMPDPSLPLHDSSDSVQGLEVTPFDDGFQYDGDRSAQTNVGIWLDAVSLVEIGLGGERGNNHSLNIDAARAEITRFTPDNAFVASLMTNIILAEYTKRPRCSPVYLVTGVMVAENATFEVKNEKSQGYKAKIVINGEGFGIPMKIGPELDRNTKDAGGPTWKLAKPFVLAYEVWKIQKKITGSIGSGPHNRHALWGEGSTTSTPSEEEWEVTPFTACNAQPK
jgi:hypothetical protein